MKGPASHTGTDMMGPAPTRADVREGPRIVPFPGEQVLAAHSLTKVFVTPFRRRRVVALDGLSLIVESGEVFGLLGPNGAGKSTSIKLMIGLIRPTSGSVRLLGRPAGDIKAKAGIGYLAENPSFYPYLTPREFLDYCGGLFGLDPDRRRGSAERLIAEMGLWKARDLRIKKLSKGMIQRLGFAQALLGDPKLLILDEPMSGLDPMGRRLVREGIFEVKARGGTVLFSSHILPDVETLCDRVGIITGGKLQRVISVDQRSIDEGTPVELIMDRLEPQIVDEGKRAGASVRKRGHTYIFQFRDANDAQRVLRSAVVRGARVLAFNRMRESLENLFLREVEPEQREDRRRAG